MISLDVDNNNASINRYHKEYDDGDIEHNLDEFTSLKAGCLDGYL